eukprot:6207418-Pleurochrysis_carterae.AAC.2
MSKSWICSISGDSGVSHRAIFVCGLLRKVLILARMLLIQNVDVRRKHPSYKRAYVYLEDEQGKHRPRYHEAEFQMTEEARQAWPAKPGRTAKDLADKIIDGTLEPSLLRRNWKKY